MLTPWARLESLGEELSQSCHGLGIVAGQIDSVDFEVLETNLSLSQSCSGPVAGGADPIGR